MAENKKEIKDKVLDVANKCWAWFKKQKTGVQIIVALVVLSIPIMPFAYSDIETRSSESGSGTTTGSQTATKTEKKEPAFEYVALKSPYDITTTKVSVEAVPWGVDMNQPSLKDEIKRRIKDFRDNPLYKDKTIIIIYRNNKSSSEILAQYNRNVGDVAWNRDLVNAEVDSEPLE